MDRLRKPAIVVDHRALRAAARRRPSGADLQQIGAPEDANGGAALSAQKRCSCEGSGFEASHVLFLDARRAHQRREGGKESSLIRSEIAAAGARDDHLGGDLGRRRRVSHARRSAHGTLVARPLVARHTRRTLRRRSPCGTSSPNSSCSPPRRASSGSSSSSSCSSRSRTFRCRTCSCSTSPRSLGTPTSRRAGCTASSGC